jgi:hypothetical protein
MVETNDFRTVLLADFGIDVDLTLSASGSKTIKAIFDSSHELADVGGTVSYSVVQPRFTCKTSDVKGLAEDDTAVIDGVTYKVKVIMPDGTGITEVLLEKQ